ncbi:MAG: peptidylprolyl isomerase [Candidatus Moranbacteria bacterium]|nr:peptidylprolyl isomerase [Candidatus Moranbacteria bacterium]
MKKIKISTLVYSLGIALAVLLSVSLFMVYGFSSSHKGADRLKDMFPYPIAFVGYGQAVTYASLSENIASVRRFYETQDFSKVGLRVDFSTKEGEKRFKIREKEILNKMIEDEVIESLAKKRGIRVSKEEVRQNITHKLEEYGSEKEVRENLDRLYGWTVNDFEEKVVMPGLYQEKLQKTFLEESDTSSRAREVIALAEEKLGSGMSFSDVAKEYSEGKTSEQGGELGWFVLEDLAPELRLVVANQKVGIPGESVESVLGFHVVLVEEIKKEEGKQLYRLRQIFARKATFADWLTEKMKEMTIVVLSPEYRWDNERARVEFRSQEMREFEQDLFENTEGDPMFFF